MAKSQKAAEEENTRRVEQALRGEDQKASPKADANTASVQVSENQDGEATRGTSQEGDTGSVKNTDSIPQNEVKDIETTPATNEVAKEADADRTADEIEFSDESNPNQKARNAQSPDQFDQDGNPRTGGYSYGVAPDDTDGTVPEKDNEGVSPTNREDAAFTSAYTDPVDVASYINGDTNDQEWDVKKQKDLEKSLSEPKSGIMARVSTSVGKYVTVLFYHNNKPLGSFTSRNFSKDAAKKHLARLKKTIV
jgi:hypothetical protein